MRGFFSPVSVALLLKFVTLSVTTPHIHRTITRFHSFAVSLARQRTNDTMHVIFHIVVCSHYVQCTTYTYTLHNLLHFPYAHNFFSSAWWFVSISRYFRYVGVAIFIQFLVFVQTNLRQTGFFGDISWTFIFYETFPQQIHCMHVYTIH